MSAVEIAIWSACLGILFSYALLSVFYAAYYRRAQVLHIGGFVLVTFVAIFWGSGLARWSLPALSGTTHDRLLLIVMPFSAAVSTWGLRSFLRAEYRDRVIDYGMFASTFVAALSVLVLFWPDHTRAIEIQALIVVGVAVCSLWLSLRAWLQGDLYALPMLVSCVALVFGLAGLYATALNMPLMTEGMQAFAAFLCAAYVVISFQALRRRHANKARMQYRLEANSDKDLLTRMWTGPALVRKIDEAIVRAKRQRKELTVLAIDFSNALAAKQVHGQQGLDQVVYMMAMRIKHLCGNDLVGRYGNHGFVAVLESSRNLRFLRSLGLRVSLNLRRPYVIDPDSDAELFSAELSVGIARLSKDWGGKAAQSASNTEIGQYDSLSAAQDILHDAFELAMCAKDFRSRVAIVDDATQKPIALEQLKLR